VLHRKVTKGNGTICMYLKITKAKNTMAPILKLDDHDEEQDIEFELSWLLSLTLQERFQLMFKKSRELIELLERNGHRRPDQIIKRT
jgi:hypothetical protein